MTRIVGGGPPKILDYLSEPSDDLAAIPIVPRTRGIDVAATLAYLTPDIDSVLQHLHGVLRFAVEHRNVVAHLSLPTQSESRSITTQSSFVTHIDFGPRPTMDDVEYTFEAVYGEKESKLWLARLAIGAIDAGRLLGHVVEVRNRNEFLGASEGEIKAEMLALTEIHYDL